VSVTPGSRFTQAPWLIAAGLLPLPWFLLWTTLGGLAAQGYHPLAQHASELSLLGGLPAAMLSLAAVGAGAAFLLFAAGLWARSGRRVAFGALAWTMFGLAMVSNGIWPMGGPLHGLYNIGIANLVAPALAALEDRRLRQDRVMYFATVTVSFASILYLWLNLTGLDPPKLRGLTQRIFSSINSAWPMAVAARMLLKPDSALTAMAVAPTKSLDASGPGRALAGASSSCTQAR
jgi:hypothetical protein